MGAGRAVVLAKISQSVQVNISIVGVAHNDGGFMFLLFLPISTHVLTEDTVERQVLNGKLRSVRFLTKTGAGLPRWAEKFVPHKLVVIVEESIVDPQKQTLVTYTRNIGYSRLIVRFFAFFVLLFTYFLQVC